MGRSIQFCFQSSLSSMTRIFMDREKSSSGSLTRQLTALQSQCIQTSYLWLVMGMPQESTRSMVFQSLEWGALTMLRRLWSATTRVETHLESWWLDSSSSQLKMAVDSTMHQIRSKELLTASKIQRTKQSLQLMATYGVMDSWWTNGLKISDPPIEESQQEAMSKSSLGMICTERASELQERLTHLCLIFGTLGSSSRQLTSWKEMASSSDHSRVSANLTKTSWETKFGERMALLSRLTYTFQSWRLDLKSKTLQLTLGLMTSHTRSTAKLEMTISSRKGQNTQSRRRDTSKILE